MREGYQDQYEDEENLPRERSRWPRPAAIFLVGSLAVVAVGIGGYAFTKGLNDEVNKVLATPNDCASGFEGGNCTTSASPTGAATTPATSTPAESSATTTTAPPIISDTPTATQSSPAPTQTTTAVPVPKAPSLPQSEAVSPDFTDLRTDHLCENADPRPCFQPIRVGPFLDEQLINPVVDGMATGPYEGHSYTVVCRVIGGTVTDAFGHSSNIWDVVPPQEFSTTFSDGVTRQGSTSQYGYVPDLWNNAGPMQPCTPDENVSGAQLADRG